MLEIILSLFLKCFVFDSVFDCFWNVFLLNTEKLPTHITYYLGDSFITSFVSPQPLLVYGTSDGQRPKVSKSIGFQETYIKLQMKKWGDREDNGCSGESSGSLDRREIYHTMEPKSKSMCKLSHESSRKEL